ncbi:hypothetical protein D3C80_1208370 [compost metagenome]
MAESCGCWRFSAIFSGMMCTHQKAPISTIGTMTMAIQEMTLAAESSASPSRIEAWAGPLHPNASKNKRVHRFIATFLCNRRTGRPVLQLRLARRAKTRFTMSWPNCDVF